MARKYPIAIRQAMQEWLVSEGLGPGYNAFLIARVWNEVSGMEHYTHRVFFKDGTLYVTFSSSVVRSRVTTMCSLLLDRINDALRQDEMFIKGKSFTQYVNQIVLR